MWNKFYGPHREADNPLYDDDCIFTPAVKVFKSDTNFPELLPEAEWCDEKSGSKVFWFQETK